MQEIYNFIRNDVGIQTNDAIIIGVSGGPDSMALLHIMNELKSEKNLKIICAHINHNIREESEQEKIDLENYCKKNNIIFEYKKIQKWTEDNFHNEARTIRYNFFEELIENYDAKYLMTAHHGDDLIETILMRIVRGSTLKGYSGFNRIVNKNNYKIIRPLITVTKDEIIKFNKENNISYAHDKSNDEDYYTRNRYRHTILPFLKSEDINVHKKFIKFSEILLENNEYINKEANKVFNEVFINGILDIEKFKKYDKVIKVKIINNILEKIYNDDLLIVSDVHVELILQLINSNKANSIVHLPNNVIAIKTYNELTFEYNENDYTEYKIEIKNIVNLPNGKIIETISKTEDNSNNIIRLSSKEISLPLYVRNKKDGDKIEVKGLNGTKKVSDIFIDSKIKPKDRISWPIVLDSENKVIWIPGLKKSKLDKKTTEEYDIILRYY